MHFPLFQISPLFSRHFWTVWKMSKILPFPDKFTHFHPSKFLTTFFFTHRPQISNSPLFSLFYDIFPPDSRKFAISPLFSKISPPVFQKFNSFLHTLGVISPPYFDHDAFMHHPMHVGPTGRPCARGY